MRPRTASLLALRVARILGMALFFSGLPGPSGAARAEETDPNRQAAALYREAVGLLDEDTARAAELLASSVALKPTARTYLLLGNAYLRLQRVEEAKTAFQHFLELEQRPGRRTRVQDLLKDLDRSYSAHLELTTDPPGATVFLDYKASGARGTTPLELLVRPGPHRVHFELEGYEPTVVKDVMVKEGQRETVHRVLLVKGCDVAVTATPAETPAQLKLRVDGKDAVAVPATVRVAPGAHSLELSGDGLVAKTVSIQCEDERPIQVTETLAAVERPTVREPPRMGLEPGRAAEEQARLARQQRIWLRVGIASAAAAVAVESLAIGSHFAANRARFGSSQHNRFRTVELGSQISAGTLAALAVGSFITYGLLERRLEKLQERSPSARLRLHAPRLGILLLPGGAGVSYGARF